MTEKTVTWEEYRDTCEAYTRVIRLAAEEAFRLRAQLEALAPTPPDPGEPLGKMEIIAQWEQWIGAKVRPAVGQVLRWHIPEAPLGYVDKWDASDAYCIVERPLPGEMERCLDLWRHGRYLLPVRWRARRVLAPVDRLEVVEGKKSGDGVDPREGEKK